MSQTTPQLIDTHAHLDSAQFDADRDEVLARAHAAGIAWMISIGTDLQSSRANVALSEKEPSVFAAVGIHPHDALTATPDTLKEIRTLAEGSKVVAIGEIGLDFFRDRAPRDAQREAFRTQIRLARELRLPIIVHDRDAHEEVLQILREESASEIGGVLHCFSGDPQMARACIELGFYISFPGTITYPKNEEIREVVRGIPLERILVETDCPYLSPQGHRGKRNEPSLMPITAEKIAEIKGLTLEDVARITTLNADTLFGLGAADRRSKIAYKIRNALYLNITNRCTNSCSFCAKFQDFTVKGHQLLLQSEPEVEEIKAAIGDPSPYEEVVFCGYGESLLRLDVVKEIARWLKSEGVKVRINSDGQANLVHGRNILPELQGLVDAISVSLNAPDATTYQQLCHSSFGEKAYEAVKEFLRQAPACIPSVTATAVTVPGIDIEACRRIAEDLGVDFREREYNEVG